MRAATCTRLSLEHWAMRATRQPRRPCAKPNQSVEMIRTRWPRVMETVMMHDRMYDSTVQNYNPGVLIMGVNVRFT